MSESMAAMLMGITLISTGVALIATCVAIAAARSAASNARKLRAARSSQGKRQPRSAAPVATPQIRPQATASPQVAYMTAAERVTP